MAQGGARVGAGKPKGYKAPHTLEASIQRQKLIEMYSQNAEEIHAALIKKAKEGDMVAIKEVLDRAHGKSLAITENTTVKTYRLDDEELKKKAETLVELQKHGATRGTQGSA